MKFSKLAIALAVATVSTGAYATNGMLMEGYGPIATGMGGASLAYDNGTAAMMNNPATLGLMSEGSRLDLAVGFLGPDVHWNNEMGSGANQQSDDKAFWMPAIGYVKKSGNLTYGAGVLAQGGMGTNYPNVLGSGSNMYAQVGVGRVIFPLAYNVNDKFTIGGSLDYVWAQMDLQMMSPMGGYVFNFRDGSDFTGAAKGSGISGKIGFTYKANDQFTFGGVYQAAGNIGDLTGDGATVKNFDMPAVVGLGLAYKPNDKWLVAADLKDILWSDSMQTVDITQGASTVGFVQNWDDQKVLALGVSYQYSEALTLRAGANFANNPIPDAYVTPLWPAIIENSYTLGFGYDFDKANAVNFSVAYAPKVTQNLNTVSPLLGGWGGGNVTHSQTNAQLMYSHRF